MKKKGLVDKYIHTMVIAISKHLVGVSKRNNFLKLIIKGNNRVLGNFNVISKLHSSLRYGINF